MYTSDQLKAAMDNTAPLPKTAGEVKALREKMFAARDAIPAYEAKIAEALRTKHTWNIDALEACLEQARTDYVNYSHELQRIGQYGAVLEAQERAQALAAAQEHQRDQSQLEFAAQQEAESKAEYQRRYLSHGGTPAAFEKAWPALWTEELHRRTLAGTDALRARLLQSGKYS